MRGKRSWLIEEIAQYVYEGFQLVQQQRTFDDVVNMVDRNFHHTVYIREDGIIVGCAIYFMLDDLTLKAIRECRVDLRNAEVFASAEKQEGNNMHIFTIRAKSMKIILNGTRDVVRDLKPKTISYFKDDQLKNLRTIKCHQS